MDKDKLEKLENLEDADNKEKSDKSAEADTTENADIVVADAADSTDDVDKSDKSAEADTTENADIVIADIADSTDDVDKADKSAEADIDENADISSEDDYEDTDEVSSTNKMRRLSFNLVTIICLCLCLCVTSFALGYTVYRVEDNYFKTGSIDINLNNGQPIINDTKFEPGMTVDRDFFIENKSTWSVYYKLYFEEVEGYLGDVLDITVMDKQGTVFLSGKLSDLTAENVPALEAELAEGQKQILTMRFHYPEEEGNEGQGQDLTFKVSAIAVQTKNNPEKEFN